MDVVPLYLESATSHGNVGVLFRFDGPVSFEDYAGGFAEKRLPRLERFTQVVARTPLNLKRPSLKPARAFDLSSHLHDVRLEPPDTELQLRTLYDGLINRHFDFRRPPWDIFIVNGLDGDHSALILHYHHCLSDGVGLVNRVFPAILDGLAAPPTGRPEALGQDEGRPQDAGRIMDEVMQEFARAPGVDLPFCRPLSGTSRHAATSFDLGELRAIRSAFGGTTNDVLLAVLGGAVDALAREMNLDTAGRYCRIIQPADVRKPDERSAEGNHLAFLPALVPLGAADGPERLRRTIAYTARTKRSGMRGAADAYLRDLPHRLPAPLLRLAFRLLSSKRLHRLGTMLMPMPSVDLYLSYVRWSGDEASLAGRGLAGLTILAPLMFDTGLCAVAFAHGGRVHIGLTADAVTFPRVDDFAERMQDAFGDLRRQANHSTAVED